ncbi:T9SS type A sorting domain-containing protein [Gelidibacter pelagius]|uniref:T9SS type A sorting domain-containing protein n=1 Tax=Gelidibacter pelagius TaxID=2819985 RepID=A0ABS3STZ6_9FLAO|nr:T9SS type A sorting domain-containing protein [Gelidibacter pelagius]MBO3099162.1 T9SS type A sorting domain-containing protein [Gelidibacter pelagius]
MKKLLLFLLSVTFTVTLFSQTTYTVNSVDNLPDNNINDTVCADVNGNCTLRAAIQNANKTSTKDVIHFNISGTGPFVIAVMDDILPSITRPIIIDGRTQPGYTNAPLIEIDGNALPTDRNGLQLIGSSEGSEIYGLSIGGFKRLVDYPFSRGYGIYANTGNHIIQANYIGMRGDGTTVNANTGDGMYFRNSGGNLVGGVQPNQGNLISGNRAAGVTFEGLATNSAATNNRVQGNLIGTDITGTLNRGNVYNVQFLNAHNNILGGNTEAARNIISGSYSETDDKVGTGIAVSGPEAYGNKIIGNYIGTDITGTKSIPNVRGGIFVLFGAHDNEIGTDQVGEGNLISGNGLFGLYFQGDDTLDSVSSNTVQGNYIGVDVTGTIALPNGRGIIMNGGQTNNNSIGGTSVNSRNVISGNDTGISLTSGRNNLVIGNYIGLNAAGNGAVPNAIGVSIRAASTNTTVGGADPSNRNIISGNSNFGISVSGIGHNIQNNYIGLNAQGTGVISNGYEGLILGGTLTDTKVSHNTISGNGTIMGRSINVSFVLAEEVHFYSNKVGTLPDGNTGVINVGVGLTLNSSSNNRIGGTTAAEGNIFGNHGTHGILMVENSSNNSVGYNSIGVGLDGTSNIGNNYSGIFITGANTGNSIKYNRIANNQTGIELSPSSGTPTQVSILENSIFDNSYIGIHLVGATKNDIGDADTGPNNLQNTPEISTITYMGGGQIEIIYAVPSSVTNSAYPLWIEFFGATNDQGKFFIDSDSYTAPGVKTVTIELPSGYDPADYENIVATATDANGNTSEFGVNVSYTLSVSQLEHQMVKLYPNPVTDKLFIQSPSSKNFNLKLVNSLGQLVMSQDSNSASAELDLSSLSRGLYVLNVMDDNRNFQTIKIIKN